MPKRRRLSGPLVVRFRSTIRLGGPPELEGEIRADLMRTISDRLRMNCRKRFGKTRQPEIQARRIVQATRFWPAKRRLVDIASLEVDYRNPTRTGFGTWKQWVTMDGGKDVGRGKAGKPRR